VAEPISLDSLRVALNRPRLLVVKDGSGGLDRTSYIHNPLDSLGLIYTDLITDRPFQPLVTTLPFFRTVIWFTGDARQNMLDESARQALGQYLEGGGNLLLTGQCAGEVAGADEFFERWLGADNTIDSIHGMQVVGVAGDPVSDGLTFLLGGAQSAMNQNRPGAAAGVNGGVEFMRWTRIEGDPAAGIRREDPESGSRSIYLSFGLEAIGSVRNMNNRTQVLSRFLTWLRTPSGAPEAESIPLSFNLGTPYPNPFNSRVVLPFYMDRLELMTVCVFDPLGRVIHQQNQAFAPGVHTWSLDASAWSGGMYFVHVNVGSTESKAVRLVLVK
ncbi:MAG: T9SS type A sorting domain-containing protein, partial [Calditrichota bacterium]